MIEVFYLFNCRFLIQTIFSRHFLLGSLPAFMAVLGVIIIQVIFTYYSGTQRLFGLDAISLLDWIILTASALPILFIVEGAKYVQRIINKKNTQNQKLELSVR
jgi:magnesium-transporting ATPase (P-type)